MLPMFFFLFFILLALRHERVGSDVGGYVDYFFEYSSYDIKEVIQKNTDILYWLLNWGIGQICDNKQVFLTIVAALTLIPIAKVYCEDRQYGFLKIVLFVNMPTFIMIFSGLRQSIAMAFVMIAYEFVKRKKLFWFLVFVVIAWGFHHTAFVAFILYPLYYVTFKKKHLWIIIPAVLTIFIFNKPIFVWATEILNTFFDERYDTTITDTGAYTTLILFALFTVLAFVLPDEKSIDKETIGLRNYLVIALVFQCFVPIHVLAMRMNYYFILFIPLLIPKILKHTKYSFADVAGLAKITMVGFFSIYFLYTVYSGCQTGDSTLNTYPYIPFWK